eukprot:tig00000158_g10176.t1
MGNAAVAVPAAVPTTKALTVDPPEPAPGSTGAERFATHAVFKKNNAVRPLIFGYNGAPPYQRGRAVESSNRGIQQGLDGIVVEAMFSLENSQDIVIASEYRDLVPGENDLDVITTKARLEKAINPQDERMKDVFLEDFLTVFKERTIVVIELKAHGQRKEELSRRVAEIIDRCQAIDSVVIASADSTILNAMRRHSPDAILAVTYRKTHKLFEGRKAGYPEPSGAKQNVHPFRSEYYRAVRGDIEARKLDINAVDIDASVLDKNCIPEFRDEKVVVGVRLMMDERGRKADRDVLEALYPSVAFVVSRDPVVALQWRAELLTERIRRNVGLPGQGRYTIRVKTGYLPQGGTDAQPYLRLTGLRGHGKIVRLGHRHHACFQTGRSDVFALEEEDLGPLQYLTLRLRGESPSERGWYLEYIEIHDRGGLGATKPEVYIFPYMDWVKCVTTSNVEGGDPTAGLVRIERPLLFGRSLAGPIEKLKADIKTGDIILYSGGSIADEAAKLRSGSKFTHAGIVIRDGADNRILVYEETLNYRESEIRDAFSDEYWDGVHAYDLFQKILGFFGSVYWLPLKVPLSQDERFRLLGYAGYYYEKRQASDETIPQGELERERRPAKADPGYLDKTVGQFVWNALVEAGVVPDDLPRSHVHELTAFNGPAKELRLTEWPMFCRLPDAVNVRTGDILLCSFTEGQNRTPFVESRHLWDHLACMIKDGHRKLWFDVTEDGPRLVDFYERLSDPRLRVVALRKIVADRDEAMEQTAVAYVKEIAEKLYPRGELLRDLYKSPAGVAPRYLSLNLSSCEVIAVLLQKMGILSEQVQVKKLAPVDFSKSDGDDLHGLEMTDKIFLKI